MYDDPGACPAYLGAVTTCSVSGVSAVLVGLLVDGAPKLDGSVGPERSVDRQAVRIQFVVTILPGDVEAVRVEPKPAAGRFRLTALLNFNPAE